MIILAIDTSEVRGSVALLHDNHAVAAEVHSDRTDYSEWLIPAVQRVLGAGGVRLDTVDLFAAATGPGSFTGVRVGLTAVKAWCEVHGKPLVGVSRLEALARREKRESGLLATFYDAQRGQIFAGLYRFESGRAERIGDEMVIAPDAMLSLVEGEAGDEKVEWVSPDPDLILQLEGWAGRAGKADRMQQAPVELATAIGLIAEERARRGEYTDPLELDANYVRRSDAEIFWKGPAAHGR